MRVGDVGHEPIGARLSGARLAVLVVVDGGEVDVAGSTVSKEILRPGAGAVGAA